MVILQTNKNKTAMNISISRLRKLIDDSIDNAIVIAKDRLYADDDESATTAYAFLRNALEDEIVLVMEFFQSKGAIAHYSFEIKKVTLGAKLTVTMDFTENPRPHERHNLSAAISYY